MKKEQKKTPFEIAHEKGECICNMDENGTRHNGLYRHVECSKHGGVAAFTSVSDSKSTPPLDTGWTKEMLDVSSPCLCNNPECNGRIFDRKGIDSLLLSHEFQVRESIGREIMSFHQETIGEKIERANPMSYVNWEYSSKEEKETDEAKQKHNKVVDTIYQRVIEG